MAKPPNRTQVAKPRTKARITKPPTKTGVSAIDNLNLREIVAAVRKKRRWSSKSTKDAETWYRLFLAVSQDTMSRDGTAAFGIEDRSDYIWHEHITSTIRYREDCAKIFDGKFLDHTPVKPKDWRERLSKSMAEYTARFGIHPRNARICCL